MCLPTHLFFLARTFVVAFCGSVLLGTAAAQTSQIELASLFAEPLVAQKRADQIVVKNRTRAAKGSATSAVPASERAALIDLYRALNGDNWVDNTNWDTNEPVSTWEGVTVVDNRVRSLILDSNGLSGELPAAIGQLQAVETIILGTCLAFCRDNRQKNEIRGEIPPQINLLRSLELLDLSDNQFEGRLPYLGDLAKLEFLDLGDAIGGNNLQGPLPDWLGDLTSLQSLLLADNRFEGGIPFLGRLTKLTHLDLSDNRLTGEVPDLRTLNLLEILNLGTLFGGNQLSGDFPDWMGQLTSLTNISMASQSAINRDAGLSGKLPDLSALTNLQTLSLSGNRIAGPFPTWIAGLVELQFIDFGVTFENNDGTVRVGLGNEMMGSVPDLSALTKLRVLTLSNNAFGPDIGPIDRIASIEVVLADSNSFVDLPDMTGLLNLDVLDVRRNRLTFEDIRPNVNVADGGNQFLRTPQQRVKVTSDFDNDRITLSINVGGTDNTTSYKWFRDDQELTGETAASIDLPNDPNDDGIYRCEATDSDISGLTLESDHTPLRRSLVVNSQIDRRRDPEAPTGVCDTGQKLPGSDVVECTLAAAIEAANQLGGGAEIGFEQSLSIVVAQENPLPPIQRPVTIDDSFANTILIGSGTPEHGLRFETGASTLQSVDINGFATAVHVAPGASVRISSDNQIFDNETGILIESSGNRVLNNTIYGNATGIEIRDGGRGISRNEVILNTLTDDPQAAGTNFNQVGLRVSGGSSTKIDRNRLAATRDAIVVVRANDTKLTLNSIGLNHDGSGPIGSGGQPIAGVRLQDDVRTEMLSNTISGISGVTAALYSEHSENLSITRNKFGTDPSGKESIPNATHGIFLTGGSGTITVSSNTVSSNSKTGIRYENSPGTGPPAINLEYNLIGTDSSGECEAASELTPCPFRNGSAGVVIDSETERVRLFGNKIGWNSGSGLFITGARGTVGAKGNFILENKMHGVLLESVPGKFFAFDNRVFLNKDDGVNATDASFIHLQGNNIGRADGRNGGSGVSIANSITVRIVENNIVSNELDGIFLDLVEDADIRTNTIWFNRGAGILDLSDPARGRVLVSLNDVSGNGSTSTGIRVIGRDATIHGNRVTDDAGDGIALDVSGTALVSSNNIFLNAALGLNNLNPTSTVLASGNWWGDASGPSGEGPGTGDGVSAGVDYSDWLTEEAAIGIATPPDPVHVPAGSSDTLLVFIQNWSIRDDVIDVSVVETGGWYAGPTDLVIGLLDSLGVGFEVPLVVPSGSAQSSITFSAVSRTDPAQTAEASLVLLSGERLLSRLSIGPDSTLVAPGDSVQYDATAYDQFYDLITPALEWSAAGGSITEDGLFTAGSLEGIYQVTARHGPTGIEATATVEVSRTVDVEESADLPKSFGLLPSYPNPFNPTTTISYDLPRTTEVTLTAYDILGRRVALLASGVRSAGRHEVTFDAAGLPSGVYLYRLQAEDYVETRTMVVIK